MFYKGQNVFFFLNFNNQINVSFLLILKISFDIFHVWSNYK